MCEVIHLIKAMLQFRVKKLLLKALKLSSIDCQSKLLCDPRQLCFWRLHKEIIIDEHPIFPRVPTRLPITCSSHNQWLFSKSKPSRFASELPTLSG